MTQMERRAFLKKVGLGAAAGAVFAGGRMARAALPKMKITRVLYYAVPGNGPTFNQSKNIVVIETDAGISGIGEGGSTDTVAQCGAMLIGEDASRIGHLWQLMFRGYFYPAGREKLHALGALDLALWDLKAKALGVPVYELLGGLSREHLECYSTGFPGRGSIAETARACMEAGFRSYRTAVADPDRGQPFNSRQAVQKTFEQCQQIREAVGPKGDWGIDFHTRLDPPDAIRLAGLIEPLNPYYVEDPVRSENLATLRAVRSQMKVPIAVGEQFGARWDTHELIEQGIIDYTRVTLPNTGGITEFMKIAALCETHYVGMIPHFTGPVALAALVHTLGVFSGPVLVEIAGAAPPALAYLPKYADFRQGKLWPNDRPGLGVELDPRALKVAAEITRRSTPIPLFRRPDGSITNW